MECDWGTERNVLLSSYLRGGCGYEEARSFEIDYKIAKYKNTRLQDYKITRLQN
jgi:hypothetical protein